jgi:prolyl oligopeptidase
MESYCSDNPEWTTVLDVDELAKKDDISWVWKGPKPLQRARDPLSENGRKTTRALLYLSRGGSDASHVKEFDLLTGDFVTENPFIIGEAKTRASYKSRDVLLVGTDTGPDSLTDSGYPRTVLEWVRGTDIIDAPVIFEGDKKDVSVSLYFDDQRENHGGIYEVRSRSLTFYTSKYWARKVLYEHLLATDDPARNGVAEPEELIEVDVQEDAEIDFVGNLMIISLRSDWEPVPGQKFTQGSLIYTDAETFMKKGKEACGFKILFEPTSRTAYETYTSTQNYLILSIMDDVKSNLEFYKLGDEGNSLTLVGGDKEAVIRSCGVAPLDSIESDKFWFTTSGYTQPSTLCLADASRIESSNSEDAAEAYVETELKSLPDQYDSCDVEVAQRTAISKDGTAIPYFLISKRDTVMDGNTPTLLYGYGGFEVSLAPHYIATAGLAWLERGGAYVEANIRGGGEFGPKWHQVSCDCFGFAMQRRNQSTLHSTRKLNRPL